MIAAWTATSTMTVVTPFLVLFGTIYLARNTKKKSVELNDKADAIHILVNSRLDEALKRITDLEGKLGLSPGEAIPHPAIVAPQTEGTP